MRVVFERLEGHPACFRILLALVWLGAIASIMLLPVWATRSMSARRA